MRKKLLAAGSALLLVAGLISLGAGPANADNLVGAVGELQPWSEATNHADYWKDAGPHDGAQCFSFDANDEGVSSNEYGSSVDKTVTLNAFNQEWPGDHFELLVVKGGSVSNNVIVHPEAGVAYASTVNKGGQQARVSHWIVCMGTTPPTPPTTVTLPADLDVSAVDECGVKDDSLTVNTSTEGVKYTTTWNGSVATVTASITDSSKYAFAENAQTTWTFEFTNVPCVTPPVDVCANIDGIQIEVPADMVQVGSACRPVQLPPMAVVTPEVASNNITCKAGGSYTLGEADGITDAIVWKVDGNLVTAGTHAVTKAGTHTVTAVPGNGHGFDFGIDNPSSWTLSFTAPKDCGDLTTLALPGDDSLASTGANSDAVNLWLLFAGGLLMLGGGLVIAEKKFRFSK